MTYKWNQSTMNEEMLKKYWIKITGKVNITQAKLNFYNETLFKDESKVNWTTYHNSTLDKEEADQEYIKLKTDTKEMSDKFKNYSATFP